MIRGTALRDWRWTVLFCLRQPEDAPIWVDLRALEIGPWKCNQGLPRDRASLRQLEESLACRTVARPSSTRGELPLAHVRSQVTARRPSANFASVGY